jgi:hypothetical protein
MGAMPIMPSLAGSSQVLEAAVGVSRLDHAMSLPKMGTAREAVAPPLAVDCSNCTIPTNQGDNHAQPRDYLYDPEQRNVHRLLYKAGYQEAAAKASRAAVLRCFQRM